MLSDGVTEQHPRKQGLKRHIYDGKMYIHPSHRATSTKTRIETLDLVVPLFWAHQSQSNIHENKD